MVDFERQRDSRWSGRNPQHSDRGGRFNESRGYGDGGRDFDRSERSFDDRGYGRGYEGSRGSGRSDESERGRYGDDSERGSYGTRDRRRDDEPIDPRGYGNGGGSEAGRSGYGYGGETGRSHGAWSESPRYGSDRTGSGGGFAGGGGGFGSGGGWGQQEGRSYGASYGGGWGAESDREDESRFGRSSVYRGGRGGLTDAGYRGMSQQPSGFSGPGSIGHGSWSGGSSIRSSSGAFRSPHESYGDDSGNWRESAYGRDWSREHAGGSWGQQQDFRGKGPKGYRRSDTRIEEDLNDCLTEDARLDASSIEVKVQDGEVTLTGTVRSRDEKRRAEDIAEQQSGVKNVQNNLRVQRETSSSDSERNQTGTNSGAETNRGSDASKASSSTTFGKSR